MNAPYPVRAPDPFAEIDREDDAILERYLSGEHDAQRLARMAAAVAQVRALPPKPEPTAAKREAARQRSDDAMRGLVAGLLDKGRWV